MSILNKIKIKKYILPYLSKSKRGTRLSEDKRAEIVMAIFHRLKTGCQWRELPTEKYFKENYSFKSVFYHFSKWCKDGSWEKMWVELLQAYRHYLDLSNIQIDGSHTRANRGGERVGFQLRKADESTNFLYLCDSQGVLVAISEPVSGEHNDLSQIRQHFEELILWLKKADIAVVGLFLNADAGFDSKNFRDICHSYQIQPNIAFNPRNASNVDRCEYFDELLYQNRFVIERAFA